eukprot:scaffold378143_cov41-Attheya_sp.AAC.1
MPSAKCRAKGGPYFFLEIWTGLRTDCKNVLRSGYVGGKAVPCTCTGRARKERVRAVQYISTGAVSTFLALARSYSIIQN